MRKEWNTEHIMIQNMYDEYKEIGFKEVELSKLAKHLLKHHK